jgi:hypothetical protein
MLGDFNPTTNSGVTVVTNSKKIDIDKATDEELIQFAHKNNRWVQRRGMMTCIITNADKGDAVRIVYDPNTGHTYRQTLSDETDKAENRARQIYAASNEYLRDVIRNYAIKSDRQKERQKE